MKVIDWIAYEASESKPEAPIGGMGGWFGTGGADGWSGNHRWADYLAAWKEPARPYAEALRDAIVAGRIWESGDWHQGEGTGVPLFEDGTVATFSFRAWGDLLAAVWSEQLGRSYCYMDFYYAGTPDKPADFEARASMDPKR